LEPFCVLSHWNIISKLVTNILKLHLIGALSPTGLKKLSGRFWRIFGIELVLGAMHCHQLASIVLSTLTIG
jgi:hypothetical protein